MGRELDLSGLTDTEAEHVLQVVQRDMKLRKSEEERLSDLKQELLEEGTRCLLLSRQSCFNRRCCIRCCSPFTFLLNPKRQCSECGYNVCKACRVYSKRGKTWLCSNCQKSRLLKTQSLEWFYTNVKKRFKRFGSAKVLKTFYRKHLAEHGALSELTDGSTYEDSICNEGSVCGSDSTFYRQTEEHSMAETLTVALRVAEEAIDEAISNADFSNASQNKQNEALYLREHRGELVEELAKTIVQKIINRRKTLAEMRAEYDQDWLLEDNTDLDHHHHQSACVKDSRSLKPKAGLWRSQSAFSLLDNDPPHLRQHSPQTLQKEGGGSAVSTWKSVDRLDNAVLKSPDGNWIALQSAQLSRPSLLTQRKGLVYSALERESGVVSAYQGLDSDNESRPQPDSSWGAALQEIHRKMTQSGSNDRISAPLMGRRGSRDNMFSDSEGNWKAKVPAEIRRPSASRRTSIIDMNFNLAGAGDREEDSEEDAGREVAKVRRSRKKRKSRKEAAACVLDRIQKDERSPPSSDAVTPDTLTSGGTTPEPVDLEDDITPQGANQVDRELTTPTLQQEDNDDVDVLQSQEKTGGSEGDGTTWRIEIDLDEGKTEDEEEDNEEEEELKDRLYRLVAQSRISYFSSTDDELDGVGRRAGEGDGHIEEEGKEEKTDGLTYKLCQLEKEVGASQFSSTEDELDRVGVEARDEEKKTGEGEKEEEVKEKEEEDGESEELAVKVCRLAKQVNANQFSSTEDELDRAGRSEDGEEAMGEGARWTLQAERDVHATQLRNLAGLVGSARRFTSTQDQLNRVGENEGRETEEGGGGGVEGEWQEAVGKARDRRESLEDLDVKMFDLRDDRDESGSDENVRDGRWTADIRQGKTEERIDRTEEERLTEDGGMEKGRICVEKVWKETEEWRKAEFETVVEAERTEEMISSQERKVQQGTQSEGKWPDENEQEERQEKEEKAKDSPWKWEPAAAEESCDEEEFNRIISSMLLMTLEDMQGETLKDKAPDNGRIRIEKREPEEVKKKSGFEVDTHSAKASQEAGCENEFEMCGDCVKTESSVKATPGENASRQKESKDNNRLQEKDSDAHEKINLSKESLFAVTIKETIEAKGTIQGQGLDKDKQEDMMMGHTADGSEETDGRHEDTKEEKKTETTEQSDTCSLQESFLSPAEIQMSSDMEIYTTIHFLSTLLEQRYSAVSLCSITTEVLKVLNATEELLQGVEGGEHTQLSNTSLPPNTQHKKLDQQFSRLEENVYVAAGTVYGLEAELGDLEDCARGICSATSDLELCFLEEQVASAAAKVQQSELQICDISARIAALRNAGLDVDTQSRLTKTRTVPIMPVTLDSSRQLRRRLPAPPVKGDKEI